jgi:methionine biosynthesis protein MetW
MTKENYKQTAYNEIAKIVERDASVLDIGCGDGSLLGLLKEQKNVKAIGIDIKEEAVLACIAKGIPVIHDDLDTALGSCRDKTYDYVILSQTLQVLKRPHKVLSEIVRIGKKAIVSFPNFGHFSMRLALLFLGRMPKSEMLPFEWYDTPNIHHLTIRDFTRFCARHGIEILEQRYFGPHEAKQSFLLSPNLFAREALFVIRQAVKI